MPDKRAAIINQNLHPNAEARPQKHTDDFCASLELQAKVLAFEEKSDLVLSVHVDEAREVIYSRNRERWRQEFSKILGGSFLGAFVPGFITSVFAGDKLWITIYTIFGFVGLFLIFWEIKK
jgi:hypothetical protein